MLPSNFKPFKCSDLERLGSENDGGYVVDKRSLLSSSNFISLGICDNWEFEKDVKKYVEFKNHFYFDNQLSYRFLVINFLKNLIKFRFIDSIKALLKIFNFNKINSQYIKATIGYDTNKSISLKSIFGSYSITESVFLKCDIEGSEYRILSDIISYQDLINGICIEFHDVDVNLEKIENFINEFNLKLCHIHANNYSGETPTGIPVCIELTFTKFDCDKAKVDSLPLAVDKPNNPLLNELILKFSDEKAS